MLTEQQAAMVKGLLARGEKQHDIAAFFGVNGGRIADIAKARKYPEVKPAAKKDLPTPAQLTGTFAVHQARQAIMRAKLGLDAALSFLDEQEANRDG